MIKSLWEKTISLSVSLYEEDVANEHSPLPLLLQVSYHHYFGNYIETIKSFFHRYIPYPINQGQIWLELQKEGIEISMTDIISNIYSLYKPEDKILKLIIHFRKVIEDPVINLLEYYKYQLKASMGIRNKKQGNVILLSQFTIQQFNNLYENFKNNSFEDFMGDDDPESQKIGFKRLLRKIDFVPLVVLLRQGRITRQYESETRLSTIRNLFSDSSLSVYLLGIEIKGDPTLGQLMKFGHSDGFLYMVMN